MVKDFNSRNLILSIDSRAIRNHMETKDDEILKRAIRQRETEMEDNRWATLSGAISMRDIELVKTILPLFPDFSNTKCFFSGGWPALFMAIELNDYDIIHTIIQRGAKIAEVIYINFSFPIRNDSSCFTGHPLNAVQYAVKIGAVDALRAIVNSGVNLKQLNPKFPLVSYIFSDNAHPASTKIKTFDYLVSLGVDACAPIKIKNGDVDIFDLICENLDEQTEDLLRHIRENHPDIWEHFDGDVRYMTVYLNGIGQHQGM